MRITPLLILGIFTGHPVSASTYEALCPNDPCTVSINASGVSSPAGFIPTGRIAQWFTGGEESYNAGSGTAGALGGATAGAIGGALLLGPIGLLGGLIGGGLAGSKAGKTADLFFNVIGYDQSGKKVTVAFRFVNPKPANKLKTELPMFTGLAMGQTRSIDELRAALASDSPSSRSTLPESLTPAASGVAAKDVKKSPPRSLLPDNLSPEPAAQPVSSEDEWEAYLKDRNLEGWAKANPKLARELRERQFGSASVNPQ